MTLTFDIPNSATIVRQTLPNGITILVYEQFTVETVLIHGSLRAGGVYESLSKNGLASMVASSLMRGTKNHDFDGIFGQLEDIGAEFDYGSGKFRLSFNGRALAEDFQTLIAVMADTLLNPIFPEEEVDEERKKRITELKFAEQDTRYVSSRAFREALYPDTHPYHYSIYGSVDSLPQITSADLASFHQQQYGPDGMIIVVVGAVHAQDAINRISDALGQWSNPAQQAKPTLAQVAQPASILRVPVLIPGKIQSDVVIGALGPSRYAPDFHPASLANSILGEFGMMGRVGNIIRERLGLAYYAYSQLDADEAQGAWHITAGVAPKNVALTIEKIRDEITRITTERVSEEDLADNQSYFTGRLPLRLESPAGIASIIHTIERYGLGLDYLTTYHDQIYACTADDLLLACQHYLHPDHLVIASAGPDVTA